MRVNSTENVSGERRAPCPVWHTGPMTPEQVSRLEQLVAAAAQAVDAGQRRQFARLLEVGATGTGAEAGDPYWATAQALHARRERDRRVLYAAVQIAARAATGQAAVLGSEWGDTVAALDGWLGRSGWRRANADPVDPHGQRLRGLACAHCGRAKLQSHVYARWLPQGRGRAYRTFARCSFCGLTRELERGPALPEGPGRPVAPTPPSTAASRPGPPGREPAG